MFGLRMTWSSKNRGPFSTSAMIPGIECISTKLKINLLGSTMIQCLFRCFSSVFFFQRFGGSAAEHDATRRQGGWLKVVWPWDGCPEAEGKSWSWYQTSCVQSGECKEEQDHIFGKELGGYWGGCTMFFYGAGTGHWFALVLWGGFSTVGDKSFPKEETIL